MHLFHASQAKKLFWWKICVCDTSYAFSFQPSNLRRHKRIHDNAFPYKCNCCPASFRYSNTLKHHLQNKHNVQPPPNSIIFRERKPGGRPPGDYPGDGRKRTTPLSGAPKVACRFPDRNIDHRVKSRGQNKNAQVRNSFGATVENKTAMTQGAVQGQISGTSTLEAEINAAVQSIGHEQQLGLDSSVSNNNAMSLASTIPPLNVMPGFRTQSHSTMSSAAHGLSLTAPNNNPMGSWPVGGATGAGANMAAMLNAESATSSILQHAHAMSALYHTSPWGMGQH